MKGRCFLVFWILVKGRRSRRKAGMAAWKEGRTRADRGRTGLFLHATAQWTRNSENPALILEVNPSPSLILHFWVVLHFSFACSPRSEGSLAFNSHVLCFALYFLKVEPSLLLVFLFFSVSFFFEVSCRGGRCSLFLSSCSCRLRE